MVRPTSAMTARSGPGRPRLLGADRLAERGALAGVLHAQVQARLDAADGERGDGDAAVVERGQELGVPPTAVAEQVVGGTGRPAGSAGGCRRCASRACRTAPRREAGRARGHHDRADLRTSALVRAGARGDRDERGDLAAGVGDELLGAVDDPLVPVELGAGAGGPRVRAAPGSVSPKPARRRPATRSGSQRCFCSSVPKVRIGLMPRPTPASSVMPMDWSTRPSSSIATHRLVKSPPDPRAPRARGQPEQAHRAHLLHDVDREVVRLVPRRDVGATSPSAKSRTA